MQRYYVRFHSCGSGGWIVHVPAIDRWAPVKRERAIEATAYVMISQVAAAPLGTFGLDLYQGPDVTSAVDFVLPSGTSSLKRWKPSGSWEAERHARSAGRLV